MITSGPLEVTNSIIANNYGESGVIYVDEETPNIPSKVIFHNNLIMDNYAKNNKIFVIEQSTAKDSNIDGNDFDQIEAAFKEARETKGMPTAIIAKTVKGKGVSFMENQVGWHGKAPNDEEYAIAMAELEKAGEALCQK